MDTTFTSAYAGQTVLSPLGLLITVALGLLVLTLPRQKAIWPFLIMACFVSQAQRIFVLGMNFDLIRILVICGGIRVFAKGEHAWFRWNRLDSVMAVWSAMTVILPVLRVGGDVLVNRLGNLYDIVGMYYLFRCLIRGFDDIFSIAKCLMYLCLVVSVFIAAELKTGRNVFAAFGGLPEMTPIRDGRLRCQGAFSHSILAGSFWSAALPIVAIGLWYRARALSIASMCAASFMLLASASATPISSLIVGVLAAGCFYIRRKLRWVRWGIVFTLVGLHMVMKQPVWHLIARMGSLGGSAWHRFSLVDGCIHHFDEWWLIGSNKGSAHWGYFTHDVANFFIVECLHGGLPLLCLFIAVIGTAFGTIGRAWRAVEQNRRSLLTCWAVGICVLIHALNLFGVSYFGQIWVGWYLTLAMVGSIGQFAVAPVRKTVVRPAASVSRGSVTANSVPGVG